MFLKGKKLEEYEGFSYRLAKLAYQNGIDEIKDLAEALYNDKTCNSLIVIRKRCGKNTPNPLDKIIRNIQLHLNEKDAPNINSKYMYAYSIIFNCSLDYLYGKTDIMSPDPTVKNICNKTGLSEKAVLTLINCQKNKERLPESMLYSEWWSELLSGECFKKLPQTWFSYSNALLELKVLQNPPQTDLTPQKIIQLIKQKVPFIIDLIPEDEMMEAISKANTYSNEDYEKKEDSKNGAFYKMLIYIENALNAYAEEWSNKQYPGYLDRTFLNELDSISNFIKHLHQIKNKE